jgi:hypothetical protein
MHSYISLRSTNSIDKSHKKQNNKPTTDDTGLFPTGNIRDSIWDKILLHSDGAKDVGMQMNIPLSLCKGVLNI